jgi:hypothetical protein
MKLKTKFKIITAVVLTLTAIIAGGGWYLSGLVVEPKVWNFDVTLENEIKNKRFDEAWYNALPKEEMTIDSPNGYKLNAVYVPAGTDKTIVFVHGHTYTLHGDYKYLEMFRSRGFNALLFDSRFHGRSGGDNVTFGLTEKMDLKACVDRAWKLQGEKGIIGVHGESMGAAVCLMHAAMDDTSAFYIVDGSIADLNRLLAYKLKAQFGLPEFPLLGAASLMSRLRGAMFFGDVSPEKEINRAKAPIFFIHGADDKKTPPENSELLFREYKGKKRLWLCPGAGHSKSMTAEPAEYERQVAEFLKENGFI